MVGACRGGRSGVCVRERGDSNPCTERETDGTEGRVKMDLFSVSLLFMYRLFVNDVYCILKFFYTNYRSSSVPEKLCPPLS